MSILLISDDVILVIC